MIGGYKVVVVTPAGRREYLELLIPQVQALADAGLVEEHHLWVNTTREGDIEYMREAERLHNGRVRLLYATIPINGSSSIHHFFQRANDPGTVYVRMDDDVIVVDDAAAFKAFVEFRLRHREYFVVFGNILNNAICTHINQRMGKLDAALGMVGYECMDSRGWADPAFASHIHDQVLQELRGTGSLARFRWDGEWRLYYHERVSINCVSWVGGDHDFVVGMDEETEICTEIPRRLGLVNAMYGGFCVVHYAFYTQREALDGLGRISEYRLALDALPDRLAPALARASLTCAQEP